MFAARHPLQGGFLGGSDSKESACNAGSSGLIPGWGRSPGGGNGHPLQDSCLENPRDGEPGGLQSVGSQRIRLRTQAGTHPLLLQCSSRVDWGLGVGRSQEGGSHHAGWRRVDGGALSVGRGHQLTAVLSPAHTSAWSDGAGQRTHLGPGAHLGGRRPLPSCTPPGRLQAGPPQRTRGCQAHLSPRVIASSWEVPSCWNPAGGPEGWSAQAGMWANLIPARVRRLQPACRPHIQRGGFTRAQEACGAGGPLT